MFYSTSYVIHDAWGHAGRNVALPYVHNHVLEGFLSDTILRVYKPRKIPRSSAGWAAAPTDRGRATLARGRSAEATLIITPNRQRHSERRTAAPAGGRCATSTPRRGIDSSPHPVVARRTRNVTLRKKHRASVVVEGNQQGRLLACAQRDHPSLFYHQRQIMHLFGAPVQPLSPDVFQERFEQQITRIK